MKKMKINVKNKSGISLIALIITIIVIIILAAIVIGGIFNTPTQVKFSRWCDEVGRMQDAVTAAHGSRAAVVATDVNYDRVDNSKIYKYIATGNEDAATEVIREKEMVKIDRTNNKLNLEIPDYENQEWYIDLKTGEVYMYPGMTYENRTYMSQADIKAGGITPPLVVVASNLKITKTNSASGEEADNNTPDGTNLWISFTASINGEAATITETIPYQITTNGNYIFHLSNSEGETTYTVAVSIYKEVTLADSIRVGDYVYYPLPTGDEAATYILNGTGELDTGYDYVANSKSTELKTASTNWRVWNIKPDGTVQIIPSDAVHAGAIYLKGHAGFVNSKDILDDISQSLYTNDTLAESVRSMTYEDDIMPKGTMPAVTETKYAYFNSSSDYSKLADTNYDAKTANKWSLTSPQTSARFYVWDKDKHSSSEEIADEINPNVKYISPTSDKPVYVTKTYSSGSISWKSLTKRTATSTETDPNNETNANSTTGYGNILGGTYSWLASPCVYVDTYDAYFYVRIVVSSNVNNNFLLGSYGNEYAGNYGLRPLVSLRSDLKITGGTGADSSHPWVLERK